MVVERTSKIIKGKSITLVRCDDSIDLDNLISIFGELTIKIVSNSGLSLIEGRGGLDSYINQDDINKATWQKVDI